MVGAHGPVLGRDRGALDQGQEVALHALAADIRPLAPFAGGDLVDLVEEDDAVLLDRLDRLAPDALLVEQPIALLGHQHVVALGDPYFLAFGLLPEGLAQHVAEIDHAHLGAGHAGDLEGRQAGAGVLDLELDLPVGELPVAQAAAEGLAGVLAGILADQGVEHALLGCELGLGLDLLAQALAGQLQRDLDEVTDDALDVSADIADLGELRRFDLEEGRVRQLGEAPRDLGLAAARGGRSSGCSSAGPPRARPRRAADVASGCARRWRPRAWRRPGRR